MQLRLFDAVRLDCVVQIQLQLCAYMGAFAVLSSKRMNKHSRCSW